MGRQSITSARIHPAIGIARVGNSPDYFIGPELPYRTRGGRIAYKDGHGRLQRQAARFRIYGYDAAGAVVAEIAASDETEIRWSVHVANKKAAWYDFRFALDLFPAEAPNWLAEKTPRRNASITGRDRLNLVIDAGPRSASPSSTTRLTGKFFGAPVRLGELRVDSDGRLIVTAGRGVADTIFADKQPVSFANSAGWYDDICDGPVHARVRIAGREIPVDPAWVVTAPPNYAPDIIASQTMYDVVYDANVNWWFPAPDRPSFRQHIMPLLQQLTDAQWVNAGFFALFGWGSRFDFRDETLLERLSQAKQTDGSDPGEALRRDIYQRIRKVSEGRNEPPYLWPPLYGDAMYTFSNDPRDFFTYTNSNLAFLKAWAQGDFVDDFASAPADSDRFENVPVSDQPEVLDRAALRWCVGGPFHPGCEMTWPMRQVMLYREGMRIRERPAHLSEPDYGDFLTPAIALADDGPLSSSGPGDITKWMAVPWHTDTATCDSGTAGDGYLPAFWPARVPNQVLTEEDYRVTIDPNQSLAAREAAFKTRTEWRRALNPGGPSIPLGTSMVRHFGDIGVVERRTNPHAPTDAAFPPEFFVESKTGLETPSLATERTTQQHERFLRARFGGIARRRSHPDRR